MADPWVVVSYSSANPKEHPFVQKLVDYLKMKNINAVGVHPNVPESKVKQVLLNAQWLVLVLTPEAVRSPHVLSLVNTAFDRVKQGHMQGVLALAFLSNPVEPEEMPYLWSTIRTYYAGESDEDQQQAFEKLSRTLGYTRVPVHAVSSPADNWASSFSYHGSTSSRPLPAYTHSAQKRRPLLIATVMIVIALFIILSGMALGLSPFKRGVSTPSSKTTPTHGHPRPIASSSATSSAAAATATAISKKSTLKSQEIYKTVIKMTPFLNDPLDQSTALDNKNQWDPIDPCVFGNDGMYHVTASAGQYMPCMERKTTFTTNFAYQVQLAFIKGDAGGLIFLSNNTVSTFYRFSLDMNGNYELRICQDCSDTKVTNGNSSREGNIAQSNIPNGQPFYTLTIIFTNKTIYLYIQGVLVNQVTNPTLSQEGEIGVFAASKTQTTEVAFSNAKVWKLQDSGQP